MRWSMTVGAALVAGAAAMAGCVDKKDAGADRPAVEKAAKEAPREKKAAPEKKAPPTPEKAAAKAEPKALETPPPELSAEQLATIRGELGKRSGKIRAIKAYRDAVPGASIAEAKLAVEIEELRLGTRGMEAARNAFVAGAEDEAVRIVAEHFDLTPEKAREHFAETRERLTPLTPARVEAFVKSGKESVALLVYHHLHPKKSVTEVVREVKAMKGR